MTDSTRAQTQPRTQPATRTRLKGCEQVLSSAYDTALLDLDGVVYTGGEAIPHAVESLAAARESGMRLAYVTNNAARTPQTVAAHLTQLGVPAGAEEVITSAQAVARLIAEQVPAGARVLTVGGAGLWAALREQGLEPVESVDDDPAAVVQGYGGPELAWGRLAEAAYAVQRGVPWFASNTDLTIPAARGIAPGNGAAVEVVRIATGATPQVAGKPKPPMHRETILRTGAQRPLIVGDRLDTDIEGAHVGGVDSLLVLTGVTDGAQLLAARPEHRPTYVAADLRALVASQPEVTPAARPEGSAGAANGPRPGGAWRCGGWTVSVDGTGGLVLAGEGEALDGLRALCAAAWTAADAADDGWYGDGLDERDVEKALGRLGL